MVGEPAHGVERQEIAVGIFRPRRVFGILHLGAVAPGCIDGRIDQQLGGEPGTAFAARLRKRGGQVGAGAVARYCQSCRIAAQFRYVGCRPSCRRQAVVERARKFGFGRPPVIHAQHHRVHRRV